MVVAAVHQLFTSKASKLTERDTLDAAAMACGLPKAKPKQRAYATFCQTINQAEQKHLRLCKCMCWDLLPRLC